MRSVTRDRRPAPAALRRLGAVCPIVIDAGVHGKLRGGNIVAPDGHVKCRRFLQIPYAYPPVGENRWRAPRPLPEDYCWEDVNGTEFGNITAQPTYLITE